MKIEAVSYRIEAIVNHFDMTIYAFSKKIQVSQATIRSIINKKNYPSADILYKINNTYNVSPNWILLGEGDMITKSSGES